MTIHYLSFGSNFKWTCSCGISLSYVNLTQAKYHAKYHVIKRSSKLNEVTCEGCIKSIEYRTDKLSLFK